MKVRCSWLKCTNEAQYAIYDNLLGRHSNIKVCERHKQEIKRFDDKNRYKFIRLEEK